MKIPDSPGIYDGLTMAEYLEIPAVRHGELMWLMRSPEFFAWRRAHAEPSDKPELGFGSAVHDLVAVSLDAMTEERFQEMYAICTEPIHSKSTNKDTLEKNRARDLDLVGTSSIPEDPQGKEAWDLFKAGAVGQVQLDFAQGEALYAVHSRIASSQVFAAMRAAADREVEQTLVWVDPGSQVLCKARPDCRYTAHDPDAKFDYRLVFDLKTARPGKSEPWEFAAEVVNKKRGYHIQGAMMLDALNILEHDDPHARFSCLPWEKEPPYLGETIFLSHDLLELGRLEYRRLLRVYHHCEEEGLWPDTSGIIHTIDAPGFYRPYDGERHYVSREHTRTIREVIDQSGRGIDPF